jgi:thiol-disulfide isomerase/thioredoxin
MRLKSMHILIIFFTIIPLFSLSAAEKAPNFALVDNKGQFIFKSKLKGNMIISFWASYCAPCKKEMPDLIKFEQKYGKSKNLLLVLINVDDNGGSPAQNKADATLREIGVEHVYLMDPYQKTLKNYNPKITVPATYLVNKDGFIIFADLGAKKDTIEKLEKAIHELK